MTSDVSVCVETSDGPVEMTSDVSVYKETRMPGQHGGPVTFTVVRVECASCIVVTSHRVAEDIDSRPLTRTFRLLRDVCFGGL